MPRTASTQKTTRGARKTRAASEISAPVLFRFPDLSPAADVEAAADSAPEAAQEPVAADETVIEKAPPAETPTATAAIQPKPVSPETEASREESPRVDAAAVAAHRTWWEHWSSGIVLLLLACALLAAGVMAFSDRSGPSDAQLADSGTAELNIPKLSDIEIPHIDASLTRTEDASVVPPEAALAEPATPVLAQSQPQPTLSTDSETDKLSQDQTPADSSDASSSLVPSGFVLGGETLSGPALSIQVDTPENQQVAKATVGMPIVYGDQPPQSISTPDRQIGFSLPALPVSGTQKQPGDSPSMYDGAMVGNPAAQPSQQDLPPLPSQTQSPTSQDSGSLVPGSLATDSSQPKTQLASGPNQLPVQGASHTSPSPGTSQASSSQPVVTAGGALQTASPDWDPEVVVRSWKQYKAKQLTSQPETYLPPPGR